MRAILLPLLIGCTSLASAQAPTPANPAASSAPAGASQAPDDVDGDVLGANGQRLTSRRDFTDPAERDAPIVCKQGDLERHAGQSVGGVFGAEWPAQPTPTSPGSTPARPVASGKMVWPRGMEGKSGLVVIAVLVAADGKPLRAEPLCATTTGFDMAARRAAMGGSYEPAVINGQAVTSPAIGVMKFQPRRNPATRRGSASDD